MSVETTRKHTHTERGWLAKVSLPAAIVAAGLGLLVLAAQVGHQFFDVLLAPWQQMLLVWCTLVGGALGAVGTVTMLYRWSLVLRRRQAFHLVGELKDQATNAPDYAQNALQNLPKEATDAAKQQLHDVGGRLSGLGAQAVAIGIAVVTLTTSMALGGAPIL